MPVERLIELRNSTRERLALNAQKIIMHSTVAIYGHRVGKPILQCGSALLLEHKGKRVLVTAAHVFEGGRNYCYWIGGPAGLIGLDGGEQIAFCHNDESGPSDVFDLAVIDLSAQQRAELSDQTFIPLHAVGLCRDNSSDRLLMISGFPSSKNKKPVVLSKGIKRSHYSLTTLGQVNEEWVGQFDFNLYQHFLMSAHPKTTTQDGEVRNTISLKGMSGGPVVDLGDWLNVEVLSGARTPDPLVIGIFTRHIDRLGLYVGSRLKPAMPKYFEQFG